MPTGTTRPPTSGDLSQASSDTPASDHLIAHNQIANRIDAPGLVVLTLDDCYISQREILEHANANGQRLTLMVTKEDLGHNFGYGLGHGAGCLDVGDLQWAVSHGHELANHTLNHIDMTSVNASTRAQQVDALTDDLVANGLPVPTTFAYPYGYRSYFSDRDLAGRFLHWRYSGPAAATSVLAAGDTFRLPGVQMSSDNYVAAAPGAFHVRHAKQLILRAARAPIVVYTVNHLGPNYVDPVGAEPSLAEYHAFLDWVAALGVQCVTATEAFSGGNRMVNAGLEAGLDGWQFWQNTGAGTHSVLTGQTPYPGGGGSSVLQLVAPSSADGSYRSQRFEATPGEQVWPACRYRYTAGGNPATVLASDDMTPASTDSLANADVGGAYTLVGTAADFDKAGGWATISSPASTLHHAILAGVSQASVDSVFAWQYDRQPAGQNLDVKFLFRYIDASNYCAVIFEAGAFGFPVLKVVKVVAGVTTQLGSVGQSPVLPGAFTPPANIANQKWWGRVAVAGTTVRVKWWKDGDPEEPNFWTYVFPALVIPTAAGAVGFGTEIGAGLSNGPVLTSFTSWTVKAPDGVTNVGARVTYFEYDSNGNQVGVFNAPAATPWRDINRGIWEQIAMDAPITLTQWTRFIEARPSLSGLAATVQFDHFIFAPLASQPDGPLG